MAPKALSDKRGKSPSSAVTIAMATYQGARWLPEQLASFTRQTVPWRLWASDDGSTDDTRALLDRFGTDRLLTGPRRGAAANFLHILHHPDLPAGPVALSDQDDVWLPHRLARGVEALARVPADVPAVYGAATRPVDANLRPIGAAAAPPPSPDIANAFLQNVLPGNTILLNAAALAALRRMPPAAPVAFHDWWIYLAIAAIGGRVIVDPAQVLLYRQHGRNVLGAHRGALARLARLKLLIDGTWRDWFWRNVAALDPHGPRLTPRAAAILGRLTAARDGPARAKAAAIADLWRQDPRETRLIHALARLGRL